MSVLVLPVTAIGNPDIQTMPNYSDEISAVFLRAGYKLIDRSAVASQAKGLRINLSKGVEDKDIKPLADALGVDAIFLGALTYHYVPGESGTKPATFNSVTDSTGKVRTIEAEGESSYNRSGYYTITSMSVRLVDAHSMTTIMTGYAEPCGNKNVDKWFVDLLKEKMGVKD
jgi:hypothetical protein